MFPLMDTGGTPVYIKYFKSSLTTLPLQISREGESGGSAGTTSRQFTNLEGYSVGREWDWDQVKKLRQMALGESCLLHRMY